MPIKIEDDPETPEVPAVAPATAARNTFVESPPLEKGAAKRALAILDAAETSPDGASGPALLESLPQSPPLAAEEGGFDKGPSACPEPSSTNGAMSPMDPPTWRPEQQQLLQPSSPEDLPQPLTAACLDKSGFDVLDFEDTWLHILPE